MKLTTFCGWGEGPDVGINIELDEREVAARSDPKFVWLDFTAAEARELAIQLVMCADQADELDKSYAEYMGVFERQTDG